MAEQQVKSRQRVADHGEVFTAEREVKAMCDLVKQETERIESRFLGACLWKREFSCGSSPPEADSGKKSLWEKPL